jgi:hypothetical protein
MCDGNMDRPQRAYLSPEMLMSDAMPSFGAEVFHACMMAANASVGRDHVSPLIRFRKATVAEAVEAGHGNGEE